MDQSEIPDYLVKNVIADPRAQEVLGQIMAKNGLTGPPGNLPFVAQRALVAVLINAGVIKLGAAPGPAPQQSLTRQRLDVDLSALRLSSAQFGAIMQAAIAEARAEDTEFAEVLTRRLRAEGAPPAAIDALIAQVK